MEIYIACFAGLLGSLLLAFVYAADRYEREPVELIQDSFLTGMTGQLVLILALSAGVGRMEWSGPWLVVTVACAALYLPFRLHREAEVDERFDGIVYTVALLGGAVCVVHLHNLPALVAASPYRDALAAGAEPDLRDLLIIASWPSLAAELGRGLAVVAAAVLVGAVLGIVKLRGWPPVRTAAACAAVGVAIVGVDLAARGGLWWRSVLVAAALTAAFAIKRRSVFRDRPEPAERDLLILGLRTVLVVLGAALLATVVLRLAVAQPEVGPDALSAGPNAVASRPGPGS